ncbi:E3 ubiquitin-protein ligase znrf2-like [Symsagittifera roscoffensis]|uniref:E3 ubiquitin-protein ligase znrf2-like n=1 Tax=Symsagittifera roscoffensis TaxID=84072 RepID=UPI00307BD3D2
MGAKASTSNVHGSGGVAGSSNNGMMLASGVSQRQQAGQSSRLRTQSSTSPQSSRRGSASRLAAINRNNDSRSARYDRFRARSVHFDYGQGSSEDESDEDSSSRPEMNSTSRRQAAALRAFLTQSVLMSGLRCPLCKQMSSDSEQFQAHVIHCLTKPRLTYNVEKLENDKDEECVICFEDFLKDECIARLPCLCIYHKKCIDDWFKVNRKCPQHPNAEASDYEHGSLLNDETAASDDVSAASTSAARPQSSTSNDLVFSEEMPKHVVVNHVTFAENNTVDVED